MRISVLTSTAMLTPSDVYLGGRLRAYLTPRPTHQRRLSSSAQPPRVDQQPALHGPAGQVEHPGARFGQQQLWLGRVGSHDQVLAVDTDGDVAVQQHGQAAEHLLLGQSRFVADQVPQPGGQASSYATPASWHVEPDRAGRPGYRGGSSRAG